MDLKKLKKKLFNKKKLKELFLKKPEKYIDVKPQITEECLHIRLDNILERTAWYECSKCKMIFFVSNSIGWERESFKTILKELKKKV